MQIWNAARWCGDFFKILWSCINLYELTINNCKIGVNIDIVETLQ